MRSADSLRVRFFVLRSLKGFCIVDESFPLVPVLSRMNTVIPSDPVSKFPFNVTLPATSSLPCNLLPSVFLTRILCTFHITVLKIHVLS